MAKIRYVLGRWHDDRCIGAEPDGSVFERDVFKFVHIYIHEKCKNIWTALTRKNRQLFVLFDKTTPTIASAFLLIA